MMFSSLLTYLLDILFPPKELEREIRKLTPETLSQRLRVKEDNGVISLLRYREPLVRHMIWMLKYRGDRGVAKLLANVLNDYLLEELSDRVLFSGPHSTFIVPLPLSQKRERERGFNQMHLIADELRKLGEYTIETDVLQRTKHTPPQTTLKHEEERKRNVRGAFVAAHQKIPKGTCIILIDDVTTTGSTLKEARKVLMDTDAEEVLCIALSH